MPPELLLVLLAAMVALQAVSVVTRREHRADAPYLLLLLLDLAALVFVHVTGRHGTLVAFVAEGVALVLTLVPRLLDGLERSALSRDDFVRAARIALVRELIVPGKSSAKQRRQLADLASARAGDGRAVARRLLAEIDQTQTPAEAAVLREELATVLFFDQRFAEGLEQVERHLGPGHVSRRPVFAAYVVRAYGEVGRLDRAAQVMTRLEEGPVSTDPQAAALMLQARLTFLAYSGCLQHVEAMLAGEAGMLLPQRSHVFLKELARARARAAELEPLPPEVRTLAETVFSRAARPLAPVGSDEKRRRPWATLSLLAVNVLVFALVEAIIRRHGSPEGMLVRAGALFRPAVLAGEWWRVFAAQYLHGGWLHLVVNMYGLYLLGRFTEQVLGAPRFLAVYTISGLTGALMSALVGRAALSVGASGAILGLLGALIVTLMLRRGPLSGGHGAAEAWRRTLLWNLIMLGALQIFIGFQVSALDNAAHLGGMAGGALAALALGASNGSRAWRGVAIAVSALLVAAALLSAVMVVRTPFTRTVLALPVREVQVSGVALQVPTHFEVDTEHGRVEDPWLGLAIAPKVVDGKPHLEISGDDGRFAPLVDRIRGSARVIIKQ